MTDRKQERFDEARERFVRAANDAGIDPELMVKIAGFESGGFNPNARPISRNPDLNTVRQFDGTMAMSSAHGYGQFLNGTWQEMVNRYGEKYGIEGAATMTRAEANAPELRTNRDLQASMLAEFTRENMERIRGIAGPNADANVYAMHNLGSQGGERFLRALQDNPNALVTDNGLMSNDVVRRNPSLYKDGERTLTVQEAYDRMGQQLAPYQRFADQVAGRTQGAPTETAPGQTPPTQTAPTQTGPQSFDDAMRTMLPTQNGTAPHITSHFGHRTLNGRDDNHGGVDFNYVGGQNGTNLEHPTVRSPVSGVVVYGEGQGNYGTVKIRDDQGNMHEILHLDSRSVRATDPPTRIEAGDPIGTMGGRGPNGPGQYAQHVHYQMRDPSGRSDRPGSVLE